MENKNIFKIESVPVFWRESNSTKTVSGIPNRFELSISLDSKLNLLKQTYSVETDKFLTEMYKQNENIGYLREDHPLSKSYGSEFIEFISTSTDITNEHILDIGCGGMYILKKLKSLGGIVSGCDPSPFAKEAAITNNIELFHSFFPNSEISKKFDVILHYDVLEHIWDPKKFLTDCASKLKENGKVIFSMPDCSEQIEEGDISLFAHQHVNFFTINSIKNLLSICGYCKINVIRSNITGKLLCSGIKKESPLQTSTLLSVKAHKEAVIFFKRVHKKYELIQDQIKRDFETIGSDEKIGFYPPLRAMPYLTDYIDDIDLQKKICFIDDNLLARGKYMCNVAIPIYPLDDKENHNCRIIYIASKAYKQRMTEKVIRSNSKILIRYI